MGLVSSCWLTPAFGAENMPGKGVNVMTRYMKIFSQREESILAAQSAGDRQQLERLLSPFFELNRRDTPPIQRDAFIAQKVSATNWQISALRVYEVGPNAIVYLTLSAAGEGDRTLVDVWEPNQQDWQLRVRFESQLSALTF